MCHSSSVDLKLSGYQQLQDLLWSSPQNEGGLYGIHCDTFLSASTILRQVDCGSPPFRFRFFSRLMLDKSEVYIDVQFWTKLSLHFYLLSRCDRKRSSNCCYSLMLPSELKRAYSLVMGCHTTFRKRMEFLGFNYFNAMEILPFICLSRTLGACFFFPVLHTVVNNPLLFSSNISSIMLRFWLLCQNLQVIQDVLSIILFLLSLFSCHPISLSYAFMLF